MVASHPPYVGITLSWDDAQCLYDHTGTMPWVPGSWSKNVRDELSEVLGPYTQPSVLLSSSDDGQPDATI